MVVAADSVCSYFFVGKNIKKERRVFAESRARILCDVFGVESDPPVSIKNLRNKIIHFDEYMDEYIRNSPNNVLVDMNTGDKKFAFRVEPKPKYLHLIFYDFRKNIFTFQDVEYDIQEIATYVSYLSKKFIDFYKKYGPTYHEFYK